MPQAIMKLLQSLSEGIRQEADTQHAKRFVSVRLCTTRPNSLIPKYPSVVKSSQSEARLPGFESWLHHLRCDLGQN